MIRQIYDADNDITYSVNQWHIEGADNEWWTISRTMPDGTLSNPRSRIIATFEDKKLADRVCEQLNLGTIPEGGDSIYPIWDWYWRDLILGK